jgi:hypothetical protein
MFSKEAVASLAAELAPAIAAQIAKGDKRSAPLEWPETMTLETVAKFLDIASADSARHLMDNLEKAGEIKRCELDGRRRYRKVDLLRLIERKTGG